MLTTGDLIGSIAGFMILYTILLVLIPIGVLLLGVAIAAFVWAVRNDQFEDLESEGSRILFDEQEPSRERPVAAAAGPAVSPRPVGSIRSGAGAAGEERS